VEPGGEKMLVFELCNKFSISNESKSGSQVI